MATLQTVLDQSAATAVVYCGDLVVTVHMEDGEAGTYSVLLEGSTDDDAVESLRVSVSTADVFDERVYLL